MARRGCSLNDTEKNQRDYGDLMLCLAPCQTTRTLQSSQAALPLRIKALVAFAQSCTTLAAHGNIGKDLRCCRAK